MTSIGGPRSARRTAARAALRRLRPWLALSVVPALACMPGCAEVFLLHPSTRALGSGLAELELDGPGRLFAAAGTGGPDGSGSTRALALIGNGSRAERAGPRWQRALEPVGITALAFDYPGYGPDNGAADLDLLVGPALGAFDRYIASGERRVVVGNSLGAAVALGVAAARPIDLLVLQNPPPLRELILIRHGWWNLWLLAIPVALQVPAELDAIENAARCTAPAIFLSANGDSTVPPSYQQDVIDAYAGPKVVIRYDGGHNARLPPEVVEALQREVAALLGD